MDLPDEELQTPLVGDRQPQQPHGPSPKHPQGLAGPGLAAPGQPATNAYVAMRNPPHDAALENEEKTERAPQLPYAAPNVHPYAVPQYQPSAYGGHGGHDDGHGGGGWGTSHRHEQPFDDARASSIDIAVSGMYTLAAALTIIQGFGMLVVFKYSAVALGLYTMAFGAVVILYDLKSIVNGVSVEAYFPFLGNYIGRALTILYFAVLCAQAHEYGGWTKVVVLYNLLVATVQGFVYFTTMTVSPPQPHMEEDLPDM